MNIHRIQIFLKKPLKNIIESNNSTRFNKEGHKTIFDLSKNNIPIDNPELLLKFDDNSDYSKFPSHSKNTIQTIEGSKTWIEAKISWRSKVRRLYNYLGKDFNPDLTNAKPKDEMSLAWQDAKGQWINYKSKLASLRGGETVIIYIFYVFLKK